MNIKRLPANLDLYLEDKNMNQDFMSEDEIYTMAVRLLEAMHEEGNIWKMDCTSSEKHCIRTFVERESKTHKLVDMEPCYKRFSKTRYL